MSHDVQRLPCRGCTSTCENYVQCGGKPWLLREQLSQSLDWAGLREEPSSDKKASESLAA